ncbi:oligopeptide ABC transporter permease [Heyndrickxia sporothermodurans]|uniref:ABC transporter permease n=1 Tax=Heyndrickxia sporothermodurans TaxID=46224 RepID=A0AB37HFP3_9BACI|nr:oligopeptide ABC transporter permease [Heyndrickxia sporothermodurans]MBL5770918.1 ABC transporter permease [Heyndrickxia sporothermodurans]MBL5778958.1 ABC transporter permease [Heyndrickxia sporothermodurans]MBL5781966.1 ABC transporter permease [Heyndrickxia sporothermodurans]MBL5788781.1 ABC transporter permease [Heyndrickxia sporothermodurans]MBL5795989.1 ABC transporter permease [Heyndrickxia sporothermodurans]
MAKYISKRIVYLILTLFIISSFTFFLMKFLPGTPFRAEEKLSDEQKIILQEKYGLNDPIPVQYGRYMVNIVKGDLGVSFQFDNQPVTKLLINRMGPSLQLGFQAMFIGTIFGILLGVLAAMFQNTWIDYGSTFLAVLGKSIPSFVFAALLQYIIGVKLEWLPVASWDSFASSIMPTIALAIFPIATAARFMRTELIEVLSSDYITLAKAKGNSKMEISFKHAVRNALIPLITVLGPMAVGLMTGSMVVEQIFAIPGIGEQFVKSIQTNDFPIIMGTTIFFAFLLTVIILIVDILYGIIDPRIRVAGGKK